MDEACLRECESYESFDIICADGYPALCFGKYEKPDPICDYPANTNCTARKDICGECEAWQNCEVRKVYTIELKIKDIIE